jgi:glutathione S-transferase
MKIYGFPLSPFVRKVHLVAAEKGVEIEMVIGNPAAPAEEFLAASPFRKIPALVDGDFSLADSTAIVTYIDALHPNPPITPGDARAKGKAVWFDEFADTILVSAGGKIVFNRFVAPKVMGRAGDEEVAKQGEAEIAPMLDYLESVVPAEGWLAGDDFSIGDISVAAMLRTLGYVGYEPDAGKHPATAAWYERVKARPSWAPVAAREAAVIDRVLSR